MFIFNCVLFGGMIITGIGLVGQMLKYCMSIWKELDDGKFYDEESEDE